MVARGLHREGPRRNAAFCAVNCAALTDELFEAAHRGTLFLDEVGELSARAQAKLLRVVQDGEVRRVGETATRNVDVRIITATNRILASEVAAGRFRQDLLFRLAVVRLSVPPCGPGARKSSCWRSTSGREPWRRPVGTLRWAVTHLRRSSATTGRGMSAS